MGFINGTQNLIKGVQYSLNGL